MWNQVFGSGFFFELVQKLHRLPAQKKTPEPERNGGNLKTLLHRQSAVRGEDTLILILSSFYSFYGVAQLNFFNLAANGGFCLTNL